MELELRVLRYFLVVAETGTMTHAAERLHITQPTLSRQMHALEESLGVQLFERGGARMRLTESGFLFQQRAQETIDLADRTQQDMAEQAERVHGIVSVSCVETAASAAFAEVLAAFHHHFPAVQYECYNADGNDIREKLDRGVLDFGLLLEPVELTKYEAVPLAVEDTWGVALPTESPLAGRQGMGCLVCVRTKKVMPTMLVGSYVFS